MKLPKADQMKKFSEENAEKVLINKIHEAASSGKLEVEIDEKQWFGFLNKHEDELISYGYKISYFDNSDGDTTIIISWR